MTNKCCKILISEVQIENFKIYKEKTFKFDGNKVVVITGANGFGKTTLIDAIEWCLTGNIKRITNCFDGRNTTINEKNRVDNKAGIIKNKDCKRSDKVKVALKLKLNDEVFEVYREQSEDNLNVVTKLEYPQTIKSETIEMLEKFSKDEGFYNYHVCDTHKSYDFLRNSRQDLLELFRDFLKERPNIDISISNLESLSLSIANQIEKREKALISQEKIQSKEELIQNIKKDLKKVDYPKEKLFLNEVVEIETLDNKMLEMQLENLNKCAYSKLKELLESIEVYYITKGELEKYQDLEVYYNTNINDLKFSINKDYFDKEKLEVLSKQIASLETKKDKSKDIKGYKELEEFLNDAEIYKPNDIIKEKAIEISSMDKKYLDTASTIQNMQEGNDVIEALSDIVKVRKGIFEYRQDGNLKCPLCGSEDNFNSIKDENDIAKIASEYLNKNNLNIANMKVELENTIKEINVKIDDVKDLIGSELQSEIDNKNNIKQEFDKSFTAHSKFFNDLNKNNIPIGINCIDFIKKEKRIIAEKIVESKIIDSNRELATNIITALDIIKDPKLMDLNSVKKVKISLSSFFDKNFEVSEFKLGLYSRKALCVNNLLKNQKLEEQEKELKSWLENNKNVNNDLVKMNSNIALIKQRVDEIKALKKDLEKKELENVGPYLSQVFHKIIKHSNIGDIKVKRNDSVNDGGIVLLDDNNSNLMNILSQGQLGILMMSYFFANMFRRNESTIFKTYFIDDITNCLDDMNVLSFVDMIKYLISKENGVLEQIFFATCDDDLEKLFIHKMQSFGIKGKKFKFTSYSKYEESRF